MQHDKCHNTMIDSSVNLYYKFNTLSYEHLSKIFRRIYKRFYGI